MGSSPALSLVPPRASVAPPMNRAALLAGLSFLDASRDAAWDTLGLRVWFDEHLVQPGSMMAPVVVTEIATGTVALHGSSSQGLASPSKLPKVLMAARVRILSALRGLLASPTDDRFLMTAIFTERVQRVRIDGENQWVVRPEATATLSSIVLCLFAADVLSHRELYDRALCICDVCDRVTFDAGATKRTSCPAHLPALSGFIRKVTIAQDPGELAPSAKLPFR